MLYNFSRCVIALLFGALGFYFDSLLSDLNLLPLHRAHLSALIIYVTIIVFFAIVGLLLAHVGIRSFLSFLHWLDSRLIHVPTLDLVCGVIGGIIGLIISSLFNNSFIKIQFFGPLFAIILNLFLGYLGVIIGAERKEDILILLDSLAIFRTREDNIKSENREAEVQPAPTLRPSNYKILDTSVLIDQRVVEIAKTGFLEGTLLIPSFILVELRHIADSADLLTRKHGRKALDILNEISKEPTIKIYIHEQDFNDIYESDRKLVRLGQILKSPLLTNDYNLNQTATLHGVKVLNIDDLANALKPIVLSDSEMSQ